MTVEMKSAQLVAGVKKKISQLALGTAWCGLSNRDACFPVFDAYIAYGGTVFDSARLYASGGSEQVLGLWMQERGVREDVVVITKGGHGTGEGLVAEDFEKEVDSELTASLEALQTDYIDIYLLHRDSPNVPVGQIMDHLNVLLARGQVRAFGVSNWNYRRLDEACEYANKYDLATFAVVSNNLALAVSTEPFYQGLVSADTVVERWHAHRKIPLFSWSSQARGFFSGHYTSEMRKQLQDKKLDGFIRRMLEVYGTDENFERLGRARELGQKKGGYTAMQMALAWVLHRPIMVVPIIGPRSVAELESCVHATSIALTDDEMKWLNLEAK